MHILHEWYGVRSTVPNHTIHILLPMSRTPHCVHTIPYCPCTHSGFFVSSSRTPPTCCSLSPSRRWLQATRTRCASQVGRGSSRLASCVSPTWVGAREGQVQVPLPHPRLHGQSHARAPYNLVPYVASAPSTCRTLMTGMRTPKTCCAQACTPVGHYVSHAAALSNPPAAMSFRTHPMHVLWHSATFSMLVGLLCVASAQRAARCGRLAPMRGGNWGWGRTWRRRRRPLQRAAWRTVAGTTAGGRSGRMRCGGRAWWRRLQVGWRAGGRIGGGPEFACRVGRPRCGDPLTPPPWCG